MLEISLESSEDVGVGTILGGVTNNIEASMLHLLKDQRDLLIEGHKFKRLKYTGKNTEYVVRFEKRGNFAHD